MILLYAYTCVGTGIFRSLLSFSEDTPESARDFAKLPQVDRMCALLMDTSRTGATVRPRKVFSRSSVVTFINTVLFCSRIRAYHSHLARNGT